MNILLAGGAGYIGSHTAVELLAAGHDVVIVDDYCNSCAEAVNRVEEVSGKKVVSYQAESSDKYTAVLIDNKNGVPYSINSEGQEGGKLRMVIATGDINVNCSFKGTIITLGKIKVNGSQNIVNEDVEIMKHLLTAQIDDEKRLYDIFNNGSSYLVSGIIAGEEAKKPENISYSDIIKYENWIKR